jgi:hypothetical protein
VDQRQQITWATDDATRAIAMLARFTKPELP